MLISRTTKGVTDDYTLIRHFIRVSNVFDSYDCYIIAYILSTIHVKVRYYTYNSRTMPVTYHTIYVLSLFWRLLTLPICC